MKHRFLKFRLFSTAFLAASVSGGVNAAEHELNRNYTVAPGGKLTVESDYGSIEVRADAGNEVRIHVRIHKDSWSERKIKRFVEHFEVDFSKTGNDVTVLAEDRNRHSGWFSGSNVPEIEFVVSVPKIYSVDLATSGGSIRVGDLEGSAECETSGGSLHFGSIKGAVNGHTSGGSIQIAECEGTLDVETSGGGITVGSTRGDVRAHTSGGSIDISETYGSVQAGTSGGSISAKFRKNPLSDCVLETSGGGIEVYGPDDLHVDLDAETSGGHVSTDYPVTLSGKIDPQHLVAVINGGGPALNLSTSGGGIRVRKIGR